MQARRWLVSGFWLAVLVAAAYFLIKADTHSTINRAVNRVDLCAKVPVGERDRCFDSVRRQLGIDRLPAKVQSNDNRLTALEKRVGVHGPRGRSGRPGRDGKDAADGRSGPVGARGPRGFRGSRGPQGFPGPRGPAGVPGPGVTSAEVRQIVCALLPPALDVC